MGTGEVLIDVETLRGALAAGEDVVILDVRWRLDRPDSRAVYREGHLPGAVRVDLDQDLADHGALAAEGRHPLPSAELLQERVRRWGIRQDTLVVVYDESAPLAAARAWWLLRYAGLARARLLDGGLRAWVAAGGPLAAGDAEASIPAQAAGDAVLAYGALPVLDIDAAAGLPGHGVLLDARAPVRYRGDEEPVDPRPGHIPGALSAPTTALVDETGRLLSADALRAHFRAVGVPAGAQVGTYCGSGVTACLQVAALTIAGFDPALYPGSYSQWALSDRPVVTGPEP